MLLQLWMFWKLPGGNRAPASTCFSLLTLLAFHYGVHAPLKATPWLTKTRCSLFSQHKLGVFLTSGAQHFHSVILMFREAFFFSFFSMFL